MIHLSSVEEERTYPGFRLVFKARKLNIEAFTYPVPMPRRDVPLCGSCEQEPGFQLLNSLCRHSLMLEYTDDTNPYKYLDTVIINYLFFHLL